MALTLNRKSLSDALKLALTCVEVKGTIPVLAFALLESEGGHVTILTTDLDVSLTTSVEVEGEAETGSMLVPARQLSQLVALFSGEAVSLARQDDAGRIKVKCGTAKHLLPTVGRDSYPMIEAVEGKQFPIKGTALRSMLERTVFAMTTEQSRWTLNGVYLEVKGGKFMATATDQARLAHIKYPVPFSEEASALIPRRAVDAILKAFEGDDPVFVKFGNDKMQFTQGVTSITTRTMVAQYPNYDLIIPKERTHKFLIGETHAPVLKRAGLTSETLARNNSPVIAFEVSRTGIKVSSRHHELGETEDVIDSPCETLNGSSVTLGIASKQLLDVLAHEPELELAFNDNDVQMKLTPTGLREYEYVYVMMPSRVD